MGAQTTLWRLAHLLFGGLQEQNPYGAPSAARALHLLSRELGIPRHTLNTFRRKPDARYHYKPLRYPKRDGSYRKIYAPSPDLKALQRKILRNYLNKLPLHAAATGFRKGGSIAANARAHLGQAVIITADIENFFDNTTAQRVHTFFTKRHKDKIGSGILTRMCTFKGALPQGAPTSPALSNLVNVSLDMELSQLLNHSGGRYTRYGDDLTFSWPSPKFPCGVKSKVQAALLSYGYRLNTQKGWTVWKAYRGEVPCITGIRLGKDGQLHPDPAIEKTIRQLRRRPHDPDAAERLRGYEGFLKTLRDPIYE